MNGRIHWVGPKGYGFIQADSGQLVFAPAVILEGLSEGEEVVVDDTEPGQKGLTALRISSRHRAIPTTEEGDVALPAN